MPNIVLSGLTAFVVTVVSIWLLRPVAIKIGLVDSPGGRKKHMGDVPLLGGIAMLSGLLFAMLTLTIPLQPFRSFFASCAILVFIGILDDFHELSARVKLIMQVIVALLMTAWGGKVVHHLGNLLFLGDINLGDWGVPFTIFAVIGVLNIVNMIDGLDGLAGGVTVIELVFMLALALLTRQYIDGKVINLIIVIICGFLCFNFPIPGRKQASVFMGDAGSMLLGFILAWFAVSLTQVPHGVYPVAMLWILALPLFDTTSIIINRLLRGRSPLTADRRHFHHVLQGFGYSPRKTTYIMLLISTLFGAIGLTGFYWQVPEGILFIMFIACFCVYYLLCSRAWIKIKSLKVNI